MSDSDERARRLLAEAGLLEPDPDERLRLEERAAVSIDAAAMVVNLNPRTIAVFGQMLPAAMRRVISVWESTNADNILRTARITDPDEARKLERQMARDMAITLLSMLFMNDIVVGIEPIGEEGG